MYPRRFNPAVVLLLVLLVPNLHAQNACPVTTQQNPSFVPPWPYPGNADAGTFWYGTDSLWTELPSNGVWRLARQPDGSYINKLFLWQQGYDAYKEPHPDISVTLRRLDVNSPALTRRHGTNAIIRGTSVMLTGIRFPSKGCWEVAVSHDSQTLTFVVQVKGPN